MDLSLWCKMEDWNEAREFDIPLRLMQSPAARGLATQRGAPIINIHFGYPIDLIKLKDFFVHWLFSKKLTHHLPVWSRPGFLRIKWPVPHLEHFFPNSGAKTCLSEKRFQKNCAFPGKLIRSPHIRLSHHCTKDCIDNFSVTLRKDGVFQIPTGDRYKNLNFSKRLVTSKIFQHWFLLSNCKSFPGSARGIATHRGAL